MPLRIAIEHHARQRPDALAIAISGHRLTYAQLHNRIARLNTALAALPAQARDTLDLPQDGRLYAFAAGNHPAAATLLPAALATPHAVALLDPHWPDALHHQTLAKLPPDAIFCLSNQTGLIDAARNLGVPAICVDTDAFEIFLGDDPSTLPWTAPTDIFLVGFTSGTTSQPKAFARARHSWRASLDASRLAFALTDQSNTFAPGPLSHGVSLYAMAETLDLGAAFHTITKFDLPEARRAMAEARRIVAVPTLLGTLANGSAQEQIVEITTAGAKLDPALLTRARAHFPRARLHEYYGASELGFVSINTHGRQSSSAPAHSVGHPFPHVSLSLRQDGAEVAQGTPGTIFVRGDLAIDGYLWGGRNSGFRREGPWATVGDIGQLNTDGSLSILGREGGMLITAGHNIYPQEIETALTDIPGITGAVVLGHTHASRGQELVAILQGDTPLDEIRSRLAIHLPRYKLPRRYLGITKFPLTQSGKIARATLDTWLKEDNPNLVPLASAS
ncbi:AMP-binding protein [Shimia abyssi]|uniref:Long-chain acyl-CoA synthetase n=1 Tax=Shimia abyssi TaxID=1662395 RepID=A0A2P8FHH7_9RHOB|nr:AMP-binding protein [Shimia abyssi]PSL21204.1 long-chain acyl-CoA synthetase [Shimia abyssi]